MEFLLLFSIQTHLRQRRQNLLLHIPDQFVDWELQTFVDIQLGYVNAHENPAFAWSFWWRLIVECHLIIDAHVDGSLH